MSMVSYFLVTLLAEIEVFARGAVVSFPRDRISVAFIATETTEATDKKINNLFE